MNKLRRDVAINRVLLTNPALDSGAIAVRGTVFHVFREAGDHDVTILRDGRIAGRSPSPSSRKAPCHRSTWIWPGWRPTPTVRGMSPGTMPSARAV